MSVLLAVQLSVGIRVMIPLEFSRCCLDKRQWDYGMHLAVDSNEILQDAIVFEKSMERNFKIVMIGLQIKEKRAMNIILN